MEYKLLNSETTDPHDPGLMLLTGALVVSPCTEETKALVWCQFVYSLSLQDQLHRVEVSKRAGVLYQCGLMARIAKAWGWQRADEDSPAGVKDRIIFDSACEAAWRLVRANVAPDSFHYDGWRSQL